MIELKDGVAVVTGAASGIGLGMARAFASEGMRLVLADIEPDALARAAHSLTADGAEVITERVDVADATFELNHLLYTPLLFSTGRANITVSM